MHIRLTNHARKTMADRGVTLDEVRDVLENYRHRWSSRRHAGTPDSNVYVYQGDQISVVAQEDREVRVVITVLLSTQTPWTDQDARSRSPQGHGHEPP